MARRRHGSPTTPSTGSDSETGGYGADYTFEATAATCASCSRPSRPRARSWGLATMIGVAGKGETLDVVPRLLITGRRVTGSSFGGVKGRRRCPSSSSAGSPASSTPGARHEPRRPGRRERRVRGDGAPGRIRPSSPSTHDGRRAAAATPRAGDHAEDGGYAAAARVTYNAMIEHRPALIVRPLDAEDVVTALTYARRPICRSRRGGGHSVAGHCVGEGSVMVDLRLMRDVTVDPAPENATCGGGASGKTSTRASATASRRPAARSATPAWPGLRLGGGIGHLIGLHGLTLDNLAQPRRW